MSALRSGIPRPRLRLPAALLVLAAAGGAAWLAGCAANEPFDPDSVPNSPPEVRIFVAPVDSGATLAPTSYYRARFAWSGIDRDGWVREYHVTLRSPADQDAPWVVTTRTDTVVSFVTDETGTTDALLRVVCRDDRGALSDTASQHFAVRNFPPEIADQADFNPLANMQLAVVDTGGTAAPDSVYWNYGFLNYRFNVQDRDGAETMDGFFRYTLVDGDPSRTWDEDDPAADPELGWVRVPFADDADIKSCELELRNVSPGVRTLTISVRDESLSDTRKQLTWEVRAPQGPVLWVPDNASTANRSFMRETLDTAYGADGWNSYEFLYTFPDRAWILLETMRLFDAVAWTGGSGNSDSFVRAAAAGGVLQQYVTPLGDETPGRLLVVSRALAGSRSTLPAAFRGAVLRISTAAAPAAELSNFGGLQLLGRDAALPPMTCTTDFAKAVGLSPLSGCEPVYRFEECCDRGCFGSTRPISPCDPVAITRWPLHDDPGAPEARVIAAGIEPEYFVRDEAVAAFGALLTLELGVAAP